MSLEILYTSPVGESLDEHQAYQGDCDPTSEDAFKHLLRHEHSYWKNPFGSGQGMFEVVRNDIVIARLTLTRVKEVDFWICVTLIVDSVPRSFLAVNEVQKSDRWIDVMFSGETELWPAVFFHPVERTHTILREFCTYAAGSDIKLPPCWSEAAVDSENKTFNREAVEKIRSCS